MNRIDRLTAIILMLQGRRVVTAEQIAEHFEVSVRTVYRDITALGEAGVPIMAEAGVGYSLMRGYHMPPVMFSEQEAAALFTVGEMSEHFGDESLKVSLGEALMKIRAVLPETGKDYVSRLSDTVGIPNPMGSSDERSLLRIQEAVVRRRCLRLVYDAGDRGVLSERVVEPLGTAYYSRRWHLIAWCRLREGLRDFRLDRIRDWELLDEAYTGHESFSVMDYLEHEVPEDDLTPVSLECDRWAVEWILGEVPCRLVEQREAEGGRVHIKALAYSVDWLAGWLLGLGTAALVHSPPELREKLAAAALKVAALYGVQAPNSAGSNPS